MTRVDPSVVRRRCVTRVSLQANQPRNARSAGCFPGAPRVARPFRRRVFRRRVPVVPLGTALTRSPSDHRACRVLERLQSSDVEIDESDLPELPTTAHRVSAAPTRDPRAASSVGVARANGTSRATSSGSASASASGVSGEPAGSGALATRARLAQRPPWGQNAASKPAKAKPATSSSTRGASLSVLKREAAEAAARRDAAALDKLDKAHSVEFVRARTQAQKSQAKRKGERNASVYNRLLRESRRSARAPPRRDDGRPGAAARAGKENDASAAGLPVRPVSGEPRARVVEGSGDRHTGHTTTEDEGGGYWATTEPEDAWTTDANDDRRSESRGGDGPAEDAARAWLDAGSPAVPAANEADTHASAVPDVGPDAVSTRRPRGSSRALVDAEPDEDDEYEAEEAEAAESEEASVASSSPGARIVPEARAAASEDERPADDETSRFDSEDDEDSFSSDVASLTLGSEDSFASASLEPEEEPSAPESSESAGRDPHPDDVDVAATLREDNATLRSKLREAAAALAASARERAEATEERERARKRAETRAAELASFRRDASRTEKTLRRSTEKAESKARRAVEDAKDAERRAKDAERRAKDAEKLAADAESRARTAMRLRESAAAAADQARKKSATLVADLERTKEALAQMTEAAEEARAEAKASLVWRVARERGEASAAEPTDRADAAAAESAARALAAAAAEAEAILVAGPEGADPLDARTPTRATTSGDDFGAARSLVSAARRATVDAGLRAEELASLRSALAGEMAAARRAEREMAKLRAKLHDAEADAHAAWAALDVERARVTTSKVASESAAGAEAAPAVDAMTPASSASPPSAFNLLSLVSPSLTRSPGHEAMETERAALDKVVAHLNARRARPETRGFAALERFGGAAGANADEATARRIAFFCFKFWQQLAATSATPGRASTPGTPRSFSPSTPSDEFAFDVDVGIQPGSREAATRSTAAGPASPSPPHPPAPLPRWEPSAAAATDSPAMIDLRTPPLERWAKR